MKENKYDDATFFDKYSQMARSQQGLAGAGEWHELRKLLPDFRGKTFLDLGCGYGWHCAYAIENGAEKGIGIDISDKMLRRAQEINGHPHICYQRSAMEDLEFGQESFDVVLSSLAFHYIEDYEQMIYNICRWLRPRGELVFSVEHPVFTAQGPQDWIYDEKGEIAHFPVDYYYIEGERQAVFLGETVKKYHRTLTTYLDALLKNGFVLNRIVEPKPPESMMDIPGMKDELRRPMMLIVSASKK